MTEIHKMTVEIFLTTDDPENAASTMDVGLEGKLRDFPDGDVVHVDVQGITPATEMEIKEHGLEEE